MYITQDFHIHTNTSICAAREATLEGYVNTGRRLGLKKMGFANHFWDAEIPFTCNDSGRQFYTPQNFEHIAKERERIKELSTDELKLYFGCEVEYAYGIHAPALTPEIAEQFDFIIVPNSHTHLAMPKDFYEPHSRHAEFMVKAYEDIIESPIAKYVTAVAHPFEAICCPYPRHAAISPISDDTFKRIFSKSARAGVALELNLECLMSVEADPVEWEERCRMFAIAKSEGSKFLFGSDAHSHSQLLEIHEGATLASRLIKGLGICEADLIEIG